MGTCATICRETSGACIELAPREIRPLFVSRNSTLIRKYARKLERRYFGHLAFDEAKRAAVDKASGLAQLKAPALASSVRRNWPLSLPRLW